MDDDADKFLVCETSVGTGLKSSATPTAFNKMNCTPASAKEEGRCVVNTWFVLIASNAELGLTERPGVGAKTGGLNAAQRKQAIAVGVKLKHTWSKAWVPVEILANWLFGDAVWKKLCASGLAGGISYLKFTIGGSTTAWLFSPPSPTEIAK